MLENMAKINQTSVLTNLNMNEKIGRYNKYVVVGNTKMNANKTIPSASNQDSQRLMGNIKGPYPYGMTLTN